MPEGYCYFISHILDKTHYLPATLPIIKVEVKIIPVAKSKICFHCLLIKKALKIQGFRFYFFNLKLPYKSPLPFAKKAIIKKAICKRKQLHLYSHKYGNKCKNNFVSTKEKIKKS